MPPPRRVVVTGLGAVTPLGCTARESWANLISGRSGISALDHPACKTAGQVPDTFAFASSHPQYQQKYLAPFMRYGVSAAEQALADAGWTGESLTRFQRESTGVCIGTGIGPLDDISHASIETASEASRRRLSPFFIPRILMNLLPAHVSMHHGFLGPNHACSTACATGANAIGDAARFIAYGDANVMLAGASEACLGSWIGMAGFARIKALSTSGVSRPFDARRDGFVPAEGAGCIVLEELEHASARGARIYAEVLGYGLTCDAHHPTHPPEDGSGAIRAMRRALDIAGIESVDYVNAHATGTPVGDVVENRAISTVFAGGPKPMVSSCKGAIGHLLGASGSVEAIFTILAVANDIVPATLNLEKFDPDLSEEFSQIDHVIGDARHGGKVDTALTNSFGFGYLCFLS
ncbi:MAG: hypothetical protein SGCHY_003707 [Lobulomycetales sp.]